MGAGGEERGRKSWWKAAAVVVLAVVAYLPSLGNGFAMDDGPLASGWVARQPALPDPVVGELHPMVFYFDHYYWYSEYVNDGLYRPVTVYTYALTFHYLGRHFGRDAEATSQHVFNVLLHGVGAWLVLLLLLRLRVPDLAAYVGAGLFAVHAIHSEVVAGVVGRAELLAFCFGLGAIVVFVRALALTSTARFVRMALAAMLFFLAYGSKESGLACLPFLFCVILADGWSRGRISTPWSRLGSGAVVAGLPLLAFLWFRDRAMTLGANDRVEFIDYVANPLYDADVVTRLATAVKLLGYGLYKCVAPWHLSANYGPGVIGLQSSFASPSVLTAIVVLGAFLFFGLRYARRSPALFLAAASFLGFAFITSNIPFAIGTIFAERLYYMPSLGVCILGALLVQRTNGHRVVLAVLALWAIGNLWVGWQRCGVWRDSETLYLAEVDNQPRSADMLVKAAGVLRTKNDPKLSARAIDYLDRALALVSGYPSALRERAAWHMLVKNSAAALRDYLDLLSSGNHYRELPEAKALAFDGLASIYLVRNNKPLAVDSAKQALKIAPNDGNAWLVIAHAGPDVLSDAELRDLFDQGSAAFLKSPGSFGGGVVPAEIAVRLSIMGEGVKADPEQVHKMQNYGADNMPQEGRRTKIFWDMFLSRGRTLVRLEKFRRACGVYLTVLKSKISDSSRNHVHAELMSLGRTFVRLEKPEVARHLYQSMLELKIPETLRTRVSAELRNLPPR